ncbi:hypothetical protein LguiB_024830 [Lonicera macranthoides]
MSFSCSECCSDLLCGEDSGILTGDWTECSSDFESPAEDEESIAGLIEEERKYVPGIDYFQRFHSQALDTSAREKSVEWILKVQRYYDFHPLTAYLSVNYLDRFLYSHRLPAATSGWPMQLLSVACLSLAAKMEEPLVPSLLDLQYWPSCIAAATLLCAANDIPKFSVVNAEHAESWCDGLSKSIALAARCPKDHAILFIFGPTQTQLRFDPQFYGLKGWISGLLSPIDRPTKNHIRRKPETKKFRAELLEKLSKDRETFGVDLDNVINVCSEANSTHTGYFFHPCDALLLPNKVIMRALYLCSAIHYYPVLPVPLVKAADVPSDMVNERLQKLRWMNQIILSPSPPIYKTGSNNDFSKWARSPMAQPLSMGQNLLSENYFVTEPPERPIGTDNWSQPNPKLKSDRFHSMLDGVLAIDFNTFSLEKKPNKKLGEGFKFLRQDNDRLYISNDISISTRDVRPEDLEKVVTIENERGESDGPLGNLDVANNVATRPRRKFKPTPGLKLKERKCQ